MRCLTGRTRLSQQVVDEVRQHFGDAVVRHGDPARNAAGRGAELRKPIIYYDKYSVAAAAYEVLSRIGEASPDLIQSRE